MGVGMRGWGNEGMIVRRDVEMSQTIDRMVYFHFSIMILAITMKRPANWVTSLCTLSMLLTETYVVTCILSSGLHKIKRHFYDFTLETNLLDSGYNITFLSNQNGNPLDHPRPVPELKQFCNSWPEYWHKPHQYFPLHQVVTGSLHE